MDQATIDLFDCDDLSAVPAPEPLSEAPAAALSRSVDTALVVGHAVPHRVVPQLLRPVLAAYVPHGGVRLATVADAAVCVAELELQEGDEVGLPLRQAAVLPLLAAVTVSNCRGVCGGHFAFLTAPDAPRLKALRLMDCPDVTTQDVKVMSNLKHLTTFAAGQYCVRLKPSAIWHIGRMANLQELDVPCLDVSDDQLTSVSALTSLRTLKLSPSSNFKGPGLQAVGALPSLTSLDMSFYSLRKDSLHGLAPLSRSLRFLSLQVRGYFANAAALDFLSTFVELEELTLSWASPELQPIARLPKLRCVRLRELTECSTTDAAVLASLPALEELSVATGYASDHAWLCCAAALPHLRTLALSSLSLLNAPMIGIIASAPLKSLSLSVSSARVSIDAFAALSALEGLEELQVNYEGPFDPSAAAHLASMPRLRTLVLGGPNVAAFREALPHLAVT